MFWRSAQVSEPRDYSYVSSKVESLSGWKILREQRWQLRRSFPGLAPAAFTQIAKAIKTEFLNIYQQADPLLLRKSDIFSKINIPLCAVICALPTERKIRLHGRQNGEHPLARPKKPYLLAGVQLATYEEYKKRTAMYSASRLSCYEAASLVLGFPSLLANYQLSALGHVFHYDQSTQAWDVYAASDQYASGTMVLFCERRVELAAPEQPMILAASREWSPVWPS